MKWITHQTGAVSLAIALQSPLLVIAASAMGAIAPDVMDQKISRLGRSRKQRQKIFNKIHRGNSHWIGWPAIALLLTMTYCPGGLAKDLLIGFALGAASHVLLDMLTPQGVPLLPFSHKSRLSLKLCATGSAGEYLFLTFLVAATIFAYGDVCAQCLENVAVYLRNIKGIF